MTHDANAGAAWLWRRSGEVGLSRLHSAHDRRSSAALGCDSAPNGARRTKFSKLYLCVCGVLSGDRARLTRDAHTHTRRNSHT